MVAILGDRQQATHVDGKLSKLDNIKTGVPQGSIIGPLLFVIFINSLPSCVTGTGSKVHMYADDTMIMFRGSNTNELQKVMNRGLDQVANWLQHHKLTLNANKTKFMIVGTQRRVSVFYNIQISINRYSIERVKAYKYLGVMLDENVSWSEHMNYTAKKVSRTIGFLKRSAKPALPAETIKLLSNVMVMPLFDYCNVAWSNCSNVLLHRLIKLHNRLARTILDAHPRTHIIDLHQALSWKDLLTRWHNYRMCEVFKCRNNMAPRYLCDRFIMPSHSFKTRSKTNGKLCMSITSNGNHGKHTFQYLGTVGWNNLNQQQREAKSLNIFKSFF